MHECTNAAQLAHARLKGHPFPCCTTEREECLATAEATCTVALHLDPGNSKALYRRALAVHKGGRAADAQADLASIPGGAGSLLRACAKQPQRASPAQSAWLAPILLPVLQAPATLQWRRCGGRSRRACACDGMDVHRCHEAPPIPSPASSLPACASDLMLHPVYNITGGGSTGGALHTAQAAREEDTGGRGRWQQVGNSTGGKRYWGCARVVHRGGGGGACGMRMRRI